MGRGRKRGEQKQGRRGLAGLPRALADGSVLLLVSTAHMALGPKELASDRGSVSQTLGMAGLQTCLLSIALGEGDTQPASHTTSSGSFNGNSTTCTCQEPSAEAWGSGCLGRSQPPAPQGTPRDRARSPAPDWCPLGERWLVSGGEFQGLDWGMQHPAGEAARPHGAIGLWGGPRWVADVETSGLLCIRHRAGSTVPTSSGDTHWHVPSGPSIPPCPAQEGGDQWLHYQRDKSQPLDGACTRLDLDVLSQHWLHGWAGIV